MVGGPASAGSLPGPGARVAGKYRIERVVGRGGMGVVYAAHHEILDQRVALKILAPEVASQATAVARFLNEARLAARLRSDHLCQVLDAGVTENGLPFIAMELLEGCDLARLLYERRAPLPVGEATEYVVQALDAVAEAHARAVVHRDLKPSNLFLTQHPGAPPVIKVLDFGISKTDDAFGTGHVPSNITSSRAIIGSPTYMSPEQIQNVKKTDHRADIWSVGVILYELMSGTLPFRGETPGEIFVQIIEGQATPLSRLRPEIPVTLSEIVARCLRRNVDERFENVVALAEALAPYAWYKHHESLARMRRAVGVRRGPGTASASVPPAAVTGNAAKTQSETGGTGNKVLLALAAVVPLVLIPVAGVLLVQRVGLGHRPTETQTSVPATMELPAASTELPAAASTTPPTPSAAPTPTETASTAPPAPTETSTQSAPNPGAAIPVEQLPTSAPSPTAQPVHVPPKKRSILQQRY
jgi:tRNA A-37 threonylcarbamoyl transferase component Bud32